MENSDLEVAEILNAIFELELGWGKDDIVSIKRDQLIKLHKLIVEFVKKLESVEIDTAVLSLLQNRYLIYYLLKEYKSLKETQIPKEIKEKVRDGMRMSNAGSGRGYSRPDKSLTISEMDSIQIVDDVLDAEENLLRESGLNQSSIAIIIQKLRRHRQQIARNISNYRVIPTRTYWGAREILLRRA